jgi:hypothetical protein
MDKRLQKNHKRKVARAKARVRVSEPDLRTPEQIKAAREASRPGDAAGKGPSLRTSPLPFRAASSTGSASKTDA